MNDDDDASVYMLSVINRYLCVPVSVMKYKLLTRRSIRQK